MEQATEGTYIGQSVRINIMPTYSAAKEYVETVYSLVKYDHRYVYRYAKFFGATGNRLVDLLATAEHIVWNAMTGKPQSERVGTPWSCSVASEAYWAS
jgi:hypothetical protein